ncbi:MAG: T9SS type A sorting domain-containing protein [Bacteroidales bacterium]|jgi:hypothetical protein|nr:T9SS type A sorting domain-containing protein [Bacteroidales bacterium]
MKKFVLLMLISFIGFFAYTQDLILTDKTGYIIENNERYATYQKVDMSQSHYFYMENHTADDIELTLAVELDRENSTILENDAELSVCWGLCSNPWIFGRLTETVPADNSMELKFDYNNPTKEGVTILNCTFINEATKEEVYTFTVEFTVLAADFLIVDKTGNIFENNGKYVTNQEIESSRSYYFYVKNFTDEDVFLTLLAEVDEENSTILQDNVSLSVDWGTSDNTPWSFEDLQETIPARGSMELRYDYDNPTKEGVTILNCAFINEATEEKVYTFTIEFTVGDYANIDMPVVNQVKAYPNPAANNFYVNYEFNSVTDNAQITLTNILGVVVKTKPLDGLSGTANIDVSGLPAGVYFYSIKANGKIVETKKMIISR